MTTRDLLRIFAAPAALAAATLVGLIAALVADGPGDVLSWITLGAAVAVCVYYALRTAPRCPPQPPHGDGGTDDTST
jgi:hypothetical protein